MTSQSTCHRCLKRFKHLKCPLSIRPKKCKECREKKLTKKL